MEGVRMRETQCDHCLNSKEEFRQPGELIAELPGADNRTGRRQQGRQRREQQQPQLLQQHEEGRVTAVDTGGGDRRGGDSASGGGGPSQNTRSRTVKSRNSESSTQSTEYNISTRSRTRREDNRNAV